MTARRDRLGEVGLARAVAQERLHAHRGVVGAEPVDEQPLLQLEAVLEGTVEPAVDRPLGQRGGRPGAVA